MTWSHVRQSSSWSRMSIVTDLYKTVTVDGKRTTAYDRSTTSLAAGSHGEDTWFYGHKSTGPFIPGAFKIMPCIHQRQKITCSHGTATYYGTYGISRVVRGQIAAFAYGGYGNPTVPSALSITGSERHTIEAVARSREGQMLIANTIAELPETVMLLKPAISAFQKKAKKLTPRKTLRRVGSALDYATSAWLSLRYGIIPTMQDIKAAMEIYDKTVQTRAELSGIRKSRAGETSANTTSSQPFVRGGSGVYCRGIDTYHATTRWTATAYYRSRLSLSRTLGVDLRGLLLSGYEGVPYSFVLDWAVDVGSWLAASIPSTDVMDLGNTLSSRQIVKSGSSISHYSMYVSMAGQVPTSGLCLYEAETYSRNCSIPIPAIPQVNLDMSRLSRRLDALSLAWQRASSFLPKR